MKCAAPETRSQTKRGGQGERADTLRSRRDAQPDVDDGEASGATPREGTTRRANVQGRQRQRQEQQPPDRNVVVEPVQSPILAGRNRQRTKWTDEMNQYVVRCYLSLTKLGTDDRPYAVDLHQQVTNRFQELRNKTIQNILDQKRTILKNNRIAPTDMDRIRQEVGIELGMQIEHPNDEINQQQEPQHENTKEHEYFEECYLRYYGMDPTARPKLPRLRTNKDTKQIITNINTLIKNRLTAETTLTEIHSLIYIGAVATLKMHKQEVKTKDRSRNYNNREIKTKQKPWVKRFENKINKIRTNIGRLTQASKHTASEKTKRRAEEIVKKYQSEQNKTIIDVLDYLKQLLAATSKRFRRYKESEQRREDNKIFSNSQKQFFRKLDQDHTQNDNENRYPEKEDIENYWKDIWTQPLSHKQEAKWIKEEKQKHRNINPMYDHRITTDEIKEAIGKTQNWKAPGADQIHNFWYKKLVTTHEKLAELFTEILNHPEDTPEFLTSGITYLLPKTTPSSENPSKYRPITCLPTIYKILTSIICAKIYKHLEANNILAEEQKGCRKNSRGCKEQLIIDSIITGNAKKTRKPLYTAYIDYQKAFDSIPHTWLEDTLKIYKIDPQIYNFLAFNMERWKTKLVLNTQEEQPAMIDEIKIQRGIFQGDALSALWFCLAINPLSTILNKKKIGYTLAPNNSINISHLIYMDDLKIYSTTKENLENLLKLTKIFTNDVKMQFGLEKCRIHVMKRGKWEPYNEDLPEAENTDTIQAMDYDELYKYLGFQQARGIEQKTTKKELTEKLSKRLKAILKTQLSARNKCKAINTYAIPAVTYSFGIINWTQTELEHMNRLIRTTCTKHRMHHPRSSVERFYIPRAQGGRGIIDISNQNYKQIDSLRKYFHKKAEQSELHETLIHADSNITPLNLERTAYEIETKIRTTNERIQSWKEKELHGRYPETINQDHIDYSASCKWLSKNNIFSETEGFMIAIQDQVVATRNYRKFIMKDHNIESDQCRMCGGHTENIEHIITGCTTLAPTEYMRRHNNVAKILHLRICAKYGIPQESIPYYKYEPQTVIETPACKIYWDRDIITDLQIQHNRPDIVITDKETNTTFLIDIAIPSPHNIKKKHTEKISKYLPLANEIKEMWQQQQVKIVPIIIGATAEIPKQLLKNIEELGINKEIYIHMQKAVVIDTCSIMRKVISSENLNEQ